MAEVSRHIERTLGMCGGEPRIAGTRITTRQIHRMNLEGDSTWSIEDILREFPHLAREQVEAAINYEESRRCVRRATRESRRTGIWGADLWCAAFMVAATEELLPSWGTDPTPMGADDDAHSRPLFLSPLASREQKS